MQQAFPGVGHQNFAEAELSWLRGELEVVGKSEKYKKAIASWPRPVFSKTQDPS